MRNTYNCSYETYNYVDINNFQIRRLITYVLFFDPKCFSKPNLNCIFSFNDFLFPEKIQIIKYLEYLI